MQGDYKGPLAGEPVHAEIQKPQSAFVWAPGEDSRIALFPIQNPRIWEFRKKMEALHWVPQEVDLSRDKQDWKKMSSDQKQFVKMQLAFFATIDILVLKNLNLNFGEDIDCIEARMVIAAQQDQECAHAESYSLQIECLMDGEERDAVLNAARTMPIIARMHEWVLRWFDHRFDIGERLIAFAAVEGVLFSASFSALQWLRELNILPGVTDFNSFIARDEGIHTLFTCRLVRENLRVKPPQKHAEAIFSSVIEVLDSFVSESLPVRLLGMNTDLMMEYTRFQADCVLIEMGYAPMYRGKNPFKFMDKLSMNKEVKTNFFEHRGSAYQNASKSGQSTLALDETPIDEDWPDSRAPEYEPVRPEDTDTWPVRPEVTDTWPVETALTLGQSTLTLDETPIDGD